MFIHMDVWACKCSRPCLRPYTAPLLSPFHHLITTQPINWEAIAMKHAAKTPLRVAGGWGIMEVTAFMLEK